MGTITLYPPAFPYEVAAGGKVKPKGGEGGGLTEAEVIALIESHAVLGETGKTLLTSFREETVAETSLTEAVRTKLNEKGGGGGVSELAGFQTAAGLEAMAKAKTLTKEQLEASGSNTAFGWHALLEKGASAGGEQNAGQNSAFGAAALEKLTNGAYNSAFGNVTLQNLTTGIQNSAFGDAALRLNKTGSYNSAYGTEALESVTEKSHNSAFGFNAARYQTGEYNQAFGNSALEGVSGKSTGSFNMAFGQAVLQKLETGENNSAFGNAAGENVSTAKENALFGMFSGKALTTGSFNSAFGAYSLLENKTGESNAAFGLRALEKNTGSKNVGIGEGAGKENTGSSSVFIGYEAGAKAVGSNLLIIANTNTATPLIEGSFSGKTLTINGELKPEKIAYPANSIAEAALSEAVRTKLNEKGGGGESIVWKAIEGLIEPKLVNINLRVGVLNGLIYLVGNVEVKEEVTSKTIILKLPEGARPEKEYRLMVGSGSTTSVNIIVKPTGEIEILGTLKTTVNPLCFDLVIPLK